MTVSTIGHDVAQRAPRRAAPVTVPQALGRLRVALDDAYMRVSREHGLTVQQAELLCAALSPLPIGVLAGTLRCEPSNVTRLVDRAAARGLLRRCDASYDRRVKMVELTRSGRAIAERFIASLEGELEDLLDGWSAARQRAAVRMLNEVSDGLQQA